MNNALEFDGQKLDLSPPTRHPFLASLRAFAGDRDHPSESACERNNG